MVSPEERQDRAHNSLERIRTLARQRKIRYEASRVQSNVAALDYTLDDVAQCLAQLLDSHFKHSIRYAGTSRWRDVYHTEFTLSGRDDADALYIKVSLDRDCIFVDLASFHLRQY